MYLRLPLTILLFIINSAESRGHLHTHSKDLKPKAAFKLRAFKRGRGKGCLGSVEAAGATPAVVRGLWSSPRHAVLGLFFRESQTWPSRTAAPRGIHTSLCLTERALKTALPRVEQKRCLRAVPSRKSGSGAASLTVSVPGPWGAPWGPWHGRVPPDPLRRLIHGQPRGPAAHTAPAAPSSGWSQETPAVARPGPPLRGPPPEHLQLRRWVDLPEQTVLLRCPALLIQNLTGRPLNAPAHTSDRNSS